MRQQQRKASPLFSYCYHDPLPARSRTLKHCLAAVSLEPSFAVGYFSDRTDYRTFDAVSLND